MSATDAEHRKLCHALLDAIERGDTAGVEACYAPEMTMWFNVTGAESSRDDNLAALATGEDVLRRRTYNDRTVNTFADGFMVQYSCNVVAHDGSRVGTSWWPTSSCRSAGCPSRCRPRWSPGRARPYLERIPLVPFLSLTAAVPAVGAAVRALELFEALVFERIQFGTKRTQSGRVPTQVRLANLRVEVDFVQTLLRDVAARMQAHAEGASDLDLLAQQELRLALAHLVRRSRDVIREIMASSGASVHYLTSCSASTATST
jgi:hypothetical protein